MKKILKTQINEEVIKEEEDKKNSNDIILEGRISIWKYDQRKRVTNIIYPIQYIDIKDIKFSILERII